MNEQLKEKFLVQDRIYRETEIVSPVLLDLINSAAVQRLKGINQLGIPDEFYHIKNFSRYEHSVGVMLLLKKLGASGEEQVAGLLHDVSHRAFSHIYDWVIGNSTKYGNDEELQDVGHGNFIRGSEIKDILARHGYTVERTTDYHNFSLLEQSLPELCADRVDYSLRELPVALAREIFHGLTVINGRIVCQNLDVAGKFSRAFLGLHTQHWGEYQAVARYYHFAEVLRRALTLGVISPGDFWTDDDNIVIKLKKTRDGQILNTLESLRQKSIPASNRSVVAYKKFRYIDPLVVTRTGLTRLSDADLEFKRMLEDARVRNKQGVVVPIRL